MNLIPTTAALVLAGALLTTPAHAGNDRVCPHADGWVKYDGLSGHSFTYPEVVPDGAAVESCVKYATNVDYGTGTTVTSDGKHEISHASFRVTPATPEPEPEEPTDPEIPEEPETPAEEPEQPKPIGLPRDKPTPDKPERITKITSSYQCGRTVRIALTIDYRWTGAQWERFRTVDRQVARNDACDPASPEADEYVPVIEEGF